MRPTHPRYPLLERFDRYSQYITPAINRGIAEHRRGVFSLSFTDREGNAVTPDTVSVRQISHEFGFGCSLFLLDQFRTPENEPDTEKNRAYREAFAKLFSVGVAPIYWDALEPVRGKPRFSPDSEYIWRRPPLDTVRDYCRENNIRMKAHCLAYNSFNPDWLPESPRDVDIALTERAEALSDRYRYDFTDMDVINEMSWVYKNCYKHSGNGKRDLPTVDEPFHERFCFDLAKRCFPLTRLFWNEGCFETFGAGNYIGPRSRYHLMLEHQMSLGTKIEGIGMQFHAFTGKDSEVQSAGPLYDPLRLIDIFDTYSDFGLPIHLSEVSIPSWSNEPEDEEIQAELVERLVRLWFSRKNVEAAIWWNLVDGTAYGDENRFHAGLLRNDMTPKPAYRVLDRLINHEWHTEYETGNTDRVIFEGFYGDYEITFTHYGKKYTRKAHLFRDTTGYDNRLADYRTTRIEI